MVDPVLGEIQFVSFRFAPDGWMMCNGQLLQIAQYQALYSLLGTTYGGDGKTTFALPDLRGRVPVHQGNGVVRGQSAGEASHVLTAAEMPAHTHTLSAATTVANEQSPEGNVRGSAGLSYSSAADSMMSGKALDGAGGSQPHDNMQPYFVLNACIAVVGVYPSAQ